jgi:DNA uptake protein ComE-like DNA-binding protein
LLVGNHIMLAHRIVPALLCLSFTSACDPGLDVDPSDRLTISPVEVEAMLDLVNAPETDVAFLDVEVELERRAAENIIAVRNGTDGVYPSADDHPFETLEEIEAVKYVGATTMERLRNFVIANPPPAGALVEGVEFTAAEATAVLWGVNQASREELDLEVGLSSTAAANVFASAPYDTLAEIASVPYVGASALEALRGYAPAWSDLSALAGTFDGVSFEASEAAAALEVANHATFEEMTGAGLYASGARAIVDHRPYDGLDEVAAVSGVGAATMQGLKTMVGE